VGIKVIGPANAFTISHDSNKKCINIKYNESIVDMREVGDIRFETIFDANLGAIRSFVEGQLENYCRSINTSI